MARTKKAKQLYRWADGKRFPVPASVAAEELNAINRAAGDLTPAAVVEAAADPESPLHPCFEWDDTVAAQRHREQQARSLINSVRIVVESGGATTGQVAYVSVSVRDSGRAYLSADAVMQDTDYREQAVAEALASLNGWRRRYSHLRELAAVFAAIDAAQGG